MRIKYPVLLLTLCVIAIAGCGTLRSATKSFFDDAGVSSGDKKEVLLELSEQEEIYKQFRPYHYMALALLGFGLVVTFTRVMSTKVGLGSIASSIALSSWATYAPANQGKIGVALGGMVLSIGIYVLKKLVIDKYLAKKEALHKQPPNAIQESTTPRTPSPEAGDTTVTL